MPNISSTSKKNLVLQNGKLGSTAAQEPVMVELDSSASSEIECAPPGQPSRRYQSKYFETQSTEGSVKRKPLVAAKELFSKRPCKTKSPKGVDVDSPKIMTKPASTDDIFKIPSSEDDKTLEGDNGASSTDEDYAHAERKRDQAYRESLQREKEAKKEPKIKRIKLNVKTYQSKTAMKRTNTKNGSSVEIMDIDGDGEGDEEDRDVQKAIKLSLADMHMDPASPPPLYVDLENEPQQEPLPSVPLPFPDQISTIGKDEAFKALNITLAFEKVSVNPFSKPAKVMVVRFPISIVGQKLEYTISNQCKSILFAWNPNTNMVEDRNSKISLEGKRQHLATLMVFTATGAKGMGKIEIPEGWMLMPTLENLKRCDTGSGFSQRKHLIGISKESNNFGGIWVVRAGISKKWEGWGSGWRNIVEERDDVGKNKREGTLYGDLRDTDMVNTPSSSSFKKRERNRFTSGESTASPTVKLSDLEISSVKKRHNPEPTDLGSPTKKMKSLWEDITENSDGMTSKRREEPKREEVPDSDTYDDESIKDISVKNTKAQKETQAKKTESHEVLTPHSTTKPRTRRPNRSRNSGIQTSINSSNSPCSPPLKGSKTVRFRTSERGEGYKTPPKESKSFGVVIGYDPQVVIPVKSSPIHGASKNDINNQVKAGSDGVSTRPISPGGKVHKQKKIMGNKGKLRSRLEEGLKGISSKWRKDRGVEDNKEDDGGEWRILEDDGNEEKMEVGE